MKSILVIDDRSSSANYAAKLALSIAKKVRANLIAFNAAIPVNILPVTEYEFVPENRPSDYMQIQETSLAKQLMLQNQSGEKFMPEITEIDPTLFSADELMPFVKQRDIWMVVKGVPGEEVFSRQTVVSVQAILDKVKCPMLLLPEKPEIKDFDRIVHTIDLRYCKLPILKYLVELATPYKASILLAHISLSGPPRAEKKMIVDLFNTEIRPILNMRSYSLTILQNATWRKFMMC
jgi:nucleotide-binding universal stress UspA family protein